MLVWGDRMPEAVLFFLFLLCLLFACVSLGSAFLDHVLLSPARRGMYTVLVGLPEDETLPQRVWAAFVQTQTGLSPCKNPILVLDLGVKEEAKEACLALADGKCRVVFAEQAQLFQFLVESATNI